MPGRLFWEQLLQLKKKKTACQNVTILTVLPLVDKWAALVKDLVIHQKLYVRRMGVHYVLLYDILHGMRSLMAIWGH